MKCDRKIWKPVWLLVAGITASGALLGCGDESTTLSRNFLLRLPTDNPTSSAVSTYRVRPSSTDIIGFEWEPAVGAESYRIVLWRVDSKDSLNLMRGHFDSSALEFEINNPQHATVRFSATDTTDQRLLKVVQHDLSRSLIADQLTALGVPKNKDLYFLWSVLARRGNKEQRSVELHRITLILED